MTVFKTDATARADGQVRPPGQPSPIPPVGVPGPMKAPNGRPPGPTSVTGIAAPPRLASPTHSNAAIVAQPGPPPEPTTPFRIPAPAYPEVIPGRLAYNPLTNEWYDPRRRNGLQSV